MVARPVQLRPGARTPTQPLEETITMSTISAAIRESTLDLLELNGVPVSR